MNQSQTHPHTNDKWLKILRDKGLRATVQRVAVLDFLSCHPHADADAIFRGLQASLSTLSLQAVHLIVHDLSANGLIRRVSLPDSISARYETRIEDNHHHIQCVYCGRIEDVDCVVGQAPCLDPAHTHNMKILEAIVVFRAVCQECDLSQQKSSQQKRESKT